MHGIKLLRLMLGNLKHLHGENAEPIVLELLDDVADGIVADGVRFDDGKSALQGLHSFGRFVLSLFSGSARSRYLKLGVGI